MTPYSPVIGGPQLNHQTRYILIIDDSVQLRSLMARLILMSCNAKNRSCAIYHLGERSEPRLTYFYHPDENLNVDETHAVADFAIFEAGSPRHALQWLREARLKKLTIVSDVMMPVDTEVGLPGLVNGLHDLKVGVNLIFVSSEPQNKSHVEALLSGQHPYFLIKGSDAWNRLPDALVQGADRFNYQVLPNHNVAPSQKPDVKISRGAQPTDLNSRRFSTATAFGAASNPSSQMRPASNPPLTDYRVAPIRRESTPVAPSAAKPGFWSRLFGWGRR